MEVFGDISAERIAETSGGGRRVRRAATLGTTMCQFGIIELDSDGQGAGGQWQTYLTQTQRLVRFAQGGTPRVRTWWTGGDGITFGNFILIVPKSFRASNRLANSGNRPPSEPADPCRVGKGSVGEIGHSTAWASRRKTGGYS
jgi:hypothetical protein